MKFSLKKFNKDRQKSLKGSQNGDYKLIENNEGKDNLAEIIINIQHLLKPNNCPYLKVGCELPFCKRILPLCSSCVSR